MKYTRRQIVEAINYWKNLLNESNDGDDSFATRKDFSERFDDQKIKEEASSYASKNTWVNAFALAYNIFVTATNSCKALYTHEKDQSKKEAFKKMFEDCRNISYKIVDMTGNAADNSLVTKKPYEG